MLSFLYNCSLLLYTLCSLPRFLWQRCVLGKYKESLSQRLGMRMPFISLAPGQKLLWIHAVSMGETRAVIPLFRQLRARFPHLAIIISSTSDTGHAEAKRSMPEAQAHFFLPFDFSWIIKKYIRHLKPAYLMLVESDIWYHLLSEAKKQGARIFLVNGKISERSTKRFQKIPTFTKRLLSQFDLLCVQNEIYCKRFLQLGAPSSKLFVTGNIKFDVSPQFMGDEQKQSFKKELGIADTDPIIAIGSSHEPEEEWFLSALEHVWKQVPELKILLVPRHPERFSKVASLLKEKNIDSLIYSERKQKKGGERVVLIDAMGLLHSCYQIAQIAIVAGSFVSHVGGHNIFEPIIYQVPVLFGPHMQNQPDFSQLIVHARAGEQIALQQLSEKILYWLQHPKAYQENVDACKTLIKQVQGSTQRTFDQIFPYLQH